MALFFSASKMDLIKNIFSHFQKKDTSTKADFKDSMTLEYNEQNASVKKGITMQSTDISTSSVDNFKYEEAKNNTIVACENKSQHTMSFDVIKEANLTYSNDTKCTKDTPCCTYPNKLNDCSKNIIYNDVQISELTQNNIYKTILNLEELDEVCLTVNNNNVDVRHNKSDLEVTLDEKGDIFAKLDKSIKDDPHSHTNSITNDYLTPETVNMNEKEQNLDNISNHVNESELKDKLFDVISISSTEDDLNQICNDPVDNLETISISSEDVNIKIESEDSDCNGYHSSDFEFISENEAELDGLIINYTPKETNINSDSVKTINITRDLKYDSASDRDLFGPGVAGSSRFHISRPNFESNDYKEKHNLPEGEDYLKLFQGVYKPVLPVSAIFLLENKSIKTSTCMFVEFEGVGFDMRMLGRRDSSETDEEYKNEADDSVNKILSMYPGENRKRRRRF